MPRNEQWTREFEPWLDSAALDEFAVVGVWATTWKLMDERPYLRTCKLDLQVFLREVLEGRRVWVSGDPAMPRSQYGSPRAGWVLLDDLDELRARIAHCEAEAAAAAAAAVSAEPELPEPDVSGAADDSGAELPAAPPPPVPRSPAPATQPAPPARASMPPGADRPPVRPAEPALKAEVDWEWRLTALAVTVCVIVTGLFVWWLYVKVSGVVDGFEAWWDRIFYTRVPAYEPCTRGNPFCRP